MKRFSETFIFLLFSIGCFAQKETFDITTYSPLKGWKKEIKTNAIAYSFVDNVKKTWCQVGIYKSTVSKGNIDTDFESEWNELAVKPYNPEKPEISNTEEDDGWKIKAASAKFTFNNAPAAVLMTTLSGYGRCVSIIATTNSQTYLSTIENFIASVDVKKPDKAPTPTPLSPDKPFVSNYKFNTTNFDDGWISIEQSDWVEVTKGSMKVLLHYPKQGTVFPTDPEPLINAAWNILVAPKYSNLKNYKIAPTLTETPRGYLVSANAIDQTSKEVYIVLFRREDVWMEFIAPDKNTFIQYFGLDVNTITYNSYSDIWKPLEKMGGYNKFAVSVSDFKGKWTDRFSSNTFYTNIYTGMSAGMSTYSSSQFFEFGTGQTYKWQLTAANSYGGNTKVAQAKGNGAFKVLNNWQIYFSDIEGKPKTYDVYFSCIKDGRVLWMNDAKYPGSGIFTGFQKEQ
jgi:hypothetical protein